MRIDPHVHCRDGNESYKETIAHVLRLCDEQSVDIIFDMPNTDPPILTAQDAEHRLKLVPHDHRHRYRLFIGATADKNQLRKAVSAVNDSEYVIGIKLYACRSACPTFLRPPSLLRRSSFGYEGREQGLRDLPTPAIAGYAKAGGGSRSGEGRSVGSLAVVSEQDQQQVYRVLAEAGYRGVLAVHCEKESLFTKAFDPQHPPSHSLARPAVAEVNSVTDQIHFAEAAGFQGILHICHVSTAAALDVIIAARHKMKITCGVTPHHLLWSSAQAKGAEGLLYKVNPPLREPADNIALRKALKEGKADWIETDHAPHPISEKLYPPYASGYPSLCLYRTLVEEILPCWGLTDDTIRNVTCHNIKRVFDERKLSYDHS